MGKPLSRPDCLRQNPRCLGKGDEEEAYIEDCYVPQRSIYDTMRINEQIDQGTKLCQQSRSTLGSTGEARGEGSTLSSNGTIGADLGSVFVSRNTENAGGVRKLDERVIFDALKLTGDPQIMSPPVGIVGPGLPIAPSSSSGVVAAVAKRRLQGSDKRDNPNRRSWKAFMPPSYPEFAERLEFSTEAERRQSGPGIPLSPLQAVPSHHPGPSTPTSSTPTSIPPHTPSPLSSAPHTPPVSSPSVTPTVSPVPPSLQPARHKPVHPMLLQKPNKHPIIAFPPSSPKESPRRTQRGVSDIPTLEQSPGASRPAHRRSTSSTKPAIIQIPEEPAESIKTSDSERDSPLLEHDQADNAPLIPPKPVFCPPTKARTWPRSITTGKRAQVGLRHNFPVLPPLPPLISEDNNTDEESLYLLDPPSPFLKEEGVIVYGGLPMSPYVSHEGLDEGLLGWDQLRERTASELKFEEDERRILAELEEEEKHDEACGILIEEDDLAQREEREWEAVLKLENKDIIDQAWDKETLESEEWELTSSSGHWPLLTPPTGFGGPGGTNASPCPSSGAESDDLFLQLERQCEDDEVDYGEGVEMCVDPDPIDPYDVPCQDEQETADFEGTLPLDEVDEEVEMITNNMDIEEPIDEMIEDFDLKRTQDCENEHSIIDEYEGEFEKCKSEEEEEEEEVQSYPTDSALGQQLESDSQPDRTDVIKVDSDTGDKLAQTETDLDSGKSSEHGDREDGEDQVGFDGTSCSPLNPYDDEQEQDTQQEDKEGDLCDQSEPNLDSSEGFLMDQSHEILDKDNDSEQAIPEDSKQTFSEMVPMETHDTEVTSNAPETCDAPSESNALNEATASISQTNSPQNIDPVAHSSPVSNSQGAGLDSKDSFEAFVVSDSFVYLAVSVPPQSPHDCPPSPLREDSVPPSPIPKPSQGTEEQDGALLSPDSFVYMAAPERPQPGRSDVGSACEDVPDQDLDSFSEGTQSGVDFVLGSMEGDSDWESEGSTLDLPLFNTDPVWDNIEPGLLHCLFSESHDTEVLTPQEDEESQKEATPCCTDPLPESGQSSPARHESPDTLPRPESDTAAEVCH